MNFRKSYWTGSGGKRKRRYTTDKFDDETALWNKQNKSKRKRERGEWTREKGDERERERKRRNIQQVWRFGVEQDVLLNNPFLFSPSPPPSGNSSNSPLTTPTLVLRTSQSSNRKSPFLSTSGEGVWSEFSSRSMLWQCSGDEREPSLDMPTR